MGDGNEVFRGTGLRFRKGRARPTDLIRRVGCFTDPRIDGVMESGAECKIVRVEVVRLIVREDRDV